MANPCTKCVWPSVDFAFKGGSSPSESSFDVCSEGTWWADTCLVHVACAACGSMSGSVSGCIFFIFLTMFWNQLHSHEYCHEVACFTCFLHFSCASEAKLLLGNYRTEFKHVQIGYAYNILQNQSLLQSLLKQSCGDCIATFRLGLPCLCAPSLTHHGSVENRLLSTQANWESASLLASFDEKANGGTTGWSQKIDGFSPEYPCGHV